MAALQIGGLIHHGHSRHCYAHPEDPSLCVKILNADKSVDIGTGGINANHLEYDLWQSLIKNNDALRPHFPVVHGLEMTEQGEGLVLELIRDDSGEISRKLKQYLAGASVEQRATLRAQLERIRKEIIKRRILIVDWTGQNFLVQESGGSITLKIVDFQSRPNTARWFKRLKAARKARKLLPVIRAF